MFKSHHWLIVAFIGLCGIVLDFIIGGSVGSNWSLLRLGSLFVGATGLSSFIYSRLVK